MGSKYSSVSVSGYNASPPADDGSAVEANKVKWSTIKTKLPDPLKTAIESVNSNLVTTLNTSARAISASDSASATDHWKTIQVNTASVIVTLADAATMAAGYIVNVANQSSGNITVALASSGDTIDGVTNTTQTIYAKEVRRYIVNASERGYISSNPPPVDTRPVAVGSSDSSKAVRFEVDGLTASTTRVITVPDRDITLGTTLGTEQATTSGTSIDFTSIPAGVRKITIQFEGVSTSGTSNMIVQLGDAGGVETSGYLGAASFMNAAVTTSNFTTGFGVTQTTVATAVWHGHVTLTLKDAANFTWVCSVVAGRSDVTAMNVGAGSKSLSAELDRVRITTVGGTDTFDAGSINIIYEH